MAKVTVNESSLQDIAAALREKSGGTETYLPSAMGAAIRALQAGGLTKTASGTTTTVIEREGTSRYYRVMRVTGLDFQPVLVFVMQSGVDAKLGGTNTSLLYNAETGALEIFAHGSTNSYVVNYAIANNPVPNGFCDVLSTSGSSMSNYTYGWIAMGI